MASSAPAGATPSLPSRCRDLLLDLMLLSVLDQSPVRSVRTPADAILETLFPGRIDLGIGRAPGSDARTAQALSHGPGALGLEHFPGQIADLVDFLHDRLPADHPFAGVRAMPTGSTAPEVWLLGSSG